MQMQEAMDKFFRKKRIERISENALKNYQYNLLTFAKFYNGRLDEMKQDDIDDYVLWLQDESELSLTTVNNKIRDLRAFLNFCKKREFAGEFEISLLRLNDPDIVPYEEEQLKLMYDACLKVDNMKNYSGKKICHYRDYVIMRTLEETGMRLNEALNLNLNDVDLRRNLIRLRETKNKKSRNVYFTTALNRELKKYLEVRQDFLYDKNLAATSFFITREGTRLNKRTIQEKIKEYGELAGIKDVRCSPHTFRHTFAKNYLRNGGDVFTLKDILGHSSLEMTYRYARAFGVEQQNRYIQVMEKYTRNKYGK